MSEDSVHLKLLGLTPVDEENYRLALRHPGVTRSFLASVIGIEEAELETTLAPLIRRKLIKITRDHVDVPAPDIALGQAILEEAQRLANEEGQLQGLRRLLPELRAEYVDQPRGRVNAPVMGEVVDEAGFISLWKRTAMESEGTVRQLRSDQWELPLNAALEELALEVSANGRQVHAIHPMRAVSAIPEQLQARVAVGQSLRFMGVVPTRLVIFGEDAAILPESWGQSSARVVVVRQSGVVQALIRLFDVFWEQATIVRSLSETSASLLERDRAVILEQLMIGNKDEQIGRALGISLRTVRRRIAELQADLGVDSRFQAGVEAVRRGWI